MGQRSRKRGQRGKPRAGTTRPTATASSSAGAARSGGTARSGARPGTEGARVSRTEERNAAIRAGLKPFGPGERPWTIRIAAGVCGAIGVVNLIAWAAGLKIAGKHPAAGGIVLFAVLMVACAIGIWRMWYGAVLAFMALLAIIVTLCTLLLIEASNALGFIVTPIIIAGCGYLFYKLVRVLSRIQMPQYPGR